MKNFINYEESQLHELSQRFLANLPELKKEVMDRKEYLISKYEEISEEKKRLDNLLKELKSKKDFLINTVPLIISTGKQSICLEIWTLEPEVQKERIEEIYEESSEKGRGVRLCPGNKEMLNYLKLSEEERKKEEGMLETTILNISNEIKILNKIIRTIRKELKGINTLQTITFQNIEKDIIIKI